MEVRRFIADKTTKCSIRNSFQEYEYQKKKIKQVAIILKYHDDKKVEEENKIKIEMKRRRKNRTSAKQLMKKIINSVREFPFCKMKEKKIRNLFSLTWKIK